MAVVNMGSKAKDVVHIGSRKSQLALIQTNHVMTELQKHHPDEKFDIISMTTTGDDILNVALSKIGEKALFTKELEKALADKEVDLVVHSLKDLPSTLPDGMSIGAILKRESSLDAVVIHPKFKEYKMETLPKNSVIGTSALRRIAQLKRRYPHLIFKDVRGNLNTRLKKLDEADDFAALILAEAGLERMGWTDRIHQVLGPEDCMYAVSQGALAVECRSDDEKTMKLISPLYDFDSLLRCVAERAFLKKLEGGCTVPVAVHSELREDDRLYLKGCVFSLDGSQAVNASSEISLNEPPTKRPNTNGYFRTGIVANDFDADVLAQAENLGSQVAALLVEKGAKSILDVAKETTANDIRIKFESKDLRKAAKEAKKKAEAEKSAKSATNGNSH